ncbi:MAG: leucine-rich repeat protein [Oscillospiraceae bacterium]|nr:leucine-rich repeat protein [Oscillospiraceae bacterium]
MKKKILSVLIAGGISLASVPCCQFNDSSISAYQLIASLRSVTLPKDVLAVGESKKLIFEWSNGAVPETIYLSSDESVATVDEEGTVTGVGDGVAVITIKTARGTTGEYNSTEVEVPVSSDARMSKDYCNKDLKLRQKLYKYDTIYHDQNDSSSSIGYSYITEKGTITNDSFTPQNDFKLILPYDVEVIKAGFELILAPQTDSIKYIYPDSLKTGDIVDRTAVLLLYNEYSVNGLSFAAYTPDYYSRYIGEGTIVVKEIDHDSKKITFEAVNGEVPGDDDAETGQCGEKAFYRLKDGVLTIYGSGEVDDYTISEQPWNYKDVKHIVIEDGITSLGTNSLKGLVYAESVTMADSVTDMGFSVFEDNYKLKEVTLSKNLNRICKRSFYNCKSLTSVTLPDGLKKIEDEVFSNCTALKKIVIPKSLEYIGRRAFVFCGTGSVSKGSENLYDFEAVTEEGSYAEQYIRSINEPIEYGSENAVSQARSYEKYDFVCLSLGDGYFREMCYPQDYFNALGQDTLYLPDIDCKCGDIAGITIDSLATRKQEYPGSHAYTYTSPYRADIICDAPEMTGVDEGWYIFGTMTVFSDNVIQVDDSSAYRYLINCTSENVPSLNYCDKIAVHLTGIISDLNMPLLQADRIVRLKDLTDYTPGDVNADNKINILDLILMKEMLLDTEADIISGAYDFNYDENFDILDVVELVKYMGGCRNLYF